MMPTPPPRLRDRLAETILDALGDPRARRRLARVHDAGWLRDARPEHVALVRARARRARRALRGRPPLPAGAALADVLEAARTLFDAGLYFEVHELLEPRWSHATGAERRAWQGLIQVAVGFQHHANGNLAGARSLLAGGSARLRAGRLAGLDLASFADAVSSAVARIDASGAGAVPTFPIIPRGAERPARVAANRPGKEDERGARAAGQGRADHGGEPGHRPGGGGDPGTGGRARGALRAQGGRSRGRLGARPASRIGRGAVRAG
jgi:predicted metal-dependent hydrolase